MDDDFSSSLVHCTLLCLFFVVVVTVEPFRVSLVELVDYLMGNTIYNSNSKFQYEFGFFCSRRENVGFSASGKFYSGSKRINQKSSKGKFFQHSIIDNAKKSKFDS